MKITLIHGEDIQKSRDRFLTIHKTLTKKGWEIIKINLETKVKLVDKISSSDSLFSDKTLYIIEKFNKIPLSQIKALTKLESDSNLLFWQQGKALQKLVKELPKGANIEKFDLPVLLFKFLDSFYPTNSFNCLKLFNQLISSTAPELVFFMLSNHLRDLYWATLPDNSLPYPTWRVSKLKTQASKFRNKKIQKILTKLSNIDIKVKTSQENLTAALDLLIALELQ